MSDPLKRGPYTKGVERRQQILREALAAYAESDGSGPSLRAIAARAGISERGLLHYFASRDELLVAILAERDAVDRERFDPEGAVSQLSTVVHRAARTPGLVRLYAEIAAAAPDTGHAAHGYFEARYARLAGVVERMLLRESEAPEGEPAPAIDAGLAARLLVAASDGLQQQWLLDPSIDLEADLQRFSDLLVASLRGDLAERRGDVGSTRLDSVASSSPPRSRDRRSDPGH